MKTPLLLLLLASAGSAQAQAIHRCVDRVNQVITYQDHPCLPSQTPAPGGQDAHARTDVDSVSATQARHRQPVSTTNRWYVAPPHFYERQVMPGDPFRKHASADYADNRARCALALRVAEQCGKFAGKFKCNDKGFVPLTADEASMFKTTALRGDQVYRMEQCAAQASRSE